MSVHLLASIPWAARVWALPFLRALCPSERHATFLAPPPRPQAAGPPRPRSHRSGVSLAARPRLDLRGGWGLLRPGAAGLVRADQRAASVQGRVDLHHPATPGRCPLHVSASTAHGSTRPPAAPGPAAAHPGPAAGRPRHGVARGDVALWYGPRAKAEGEVEITSDTALWYHAGKPPVALRWVLIRDPTGRFAPQALCSPRT